MAVGWVDEGSWAGVSSCRSFPFRSVGSVAFLFMFLNSGLCVGYSKRAE